MNKNQRIVKNYFYDKDSSVSYDKQSNSTYSIENKQQIEIAIEIKNFKKAYQLIKNISEDNHWSACKKAYILFQLGSVHQSFYALTECFQLYLKNCTECLDLLLKLIQKSRPKLSKFSQLVNTCLKFQNISSQNRKKLQQIALQINKKQIIHTPKFQDIKQLILYYKKDIVLNKMQIVQICHQYRKAVAKQVIQPGQIIIEIPQKSLITLQMAKSQVQIQPLVRQQLRFHAPKHTILSLFLIIHKKKSYNSPYYNYLKCLPRKLDTFPFFYTQKQLQQLYGTTFLHMFHNKKMQIQEDYERVLKMLPYFRQFLSFQQFQWARMIISSRVFGIDVDGYHTDALAPIADMLNHRFTQTTSWQFNNQKRAFIVQNSKQTIQKGQQIFYSYGCKSNTKLLMNYGFTIHNNPYNEVSIRYKKYKSQKIVINMKISTDLTNDQFQMLLTYHRRYALDHSGSHKNNKNQANQFISKDNQCKTWLYILQIMQQRMKDYINSIKEDERILKKQQIQSCNLKNCIQIRLGQKKILDFYIKMANIFIKYFSRGTKVKNMQEYNIYLHKIGYLKLQT